MDVSNASYYIYLKKKKEKRKRIKVANRGTPKKREDLYH
jgi:hypothetical protein